MANYTTRYDETKRVELPGDFWVEIRVCLTGTQKRKLEKIRVKRGIEKELDARGKETGKVTSVITEIDQDRYLYELAITSIVDWNLPGGDEGEKWPLSPDSAKRASYDKLDEDDQAAIEDACIADNEDPTKDTDAQFSGAGEGSIPAGQDESPDGGQVLDREPVVAAPGSAV